MKKLRVRAILKAKGYKQNKQFGYWASEDHIYSYRGKSPQGEKLLNIIKELEEEVCYTCDGHTVDNDGITCTTCKGAGVV